MWRKHRPSNHALAIIDNHASKHALDLRVDVGYVGVVEAGRPLLLDLAQRGVVPIIGLDYMDKPAEGSQWLEKHGNPYQLAVQDRDGKVGIDYGVYGVPETYIIDKAGVIRFKHIGPLTVDLLNQKIYPMLSELKKS